MQPLRLHVPFLVAVSISFFFIFTLGYYLLDSDTSVIFRIGIFQGSNSRSNLLGATVQKLVPCYGARGSLLYDNPDDKLNAVHLDTPYPEPFAGSFDALGLEKTWMTVDGRYGPYGYGEDKPGYTRSKVDWEKVDWAQLQNHCLSGNRRRFESAENVSNKPRFHLHTKIEKFKSSLRSVLSHHSNTQPEDRTSQNRQQVIVLRGYDDYEYKDKDLHNIRALITEAGLASGGEYAVVLMIHVRDKQMNIFDSEENYNRVFNKIVPSELRSITILFDDHLLKSWYPKLGEHSPRLQNFQPLQLFAHFYPTYSHYWNIELDVRFTGNAYSYLSSLHNFSRAEPRKQSRERASYFYIPAIHGTYSQFTSFVNSSLDGKGQWGPLTIPEIPHPLGPVTPVTTPQEDEFNWGAGEESDFIATSPCTDVHRMDDWGFKSYIHNFSLGEQTPRVACPPAISRQSYRLLLSIHSAQVSSALLLPSEATIPSFCLYHNFKFSYPPLPFFLSPPPESLEEITALNKFWNGDTNPYGMAYGEAFYDAKWRFEDVDRGSWWFKSQFGGKFMGGWYDEGTDGINKKGGEGEGKERGKERLFLLREKDGLVFAPNIGLHPVKTNPL